MARIDWSKDRDRRRLREQGADPILGDVILPGRPNQRPGKAALRAELAAATQKITREIKCCCGHSGVAVIPAAWAGKTLRCTVCGRAAN
ncbi:hypothetical protein [Shinella granuli]|uniref:hypothetical protein n=1 Tax=Shinella granuli TaxID=323621 RepID=UPI0013C2FB5F|nr:hypothetical protein [Shinella granuli]